MGLLVQAGLGFLRNIFRSSGQCSSLLDLKRFRLLIVLVLLQIQMVRSLGHAQALFFQKVVFHRLLVLNFGSAIMVAAAHFTGRVPSLLVSGLLSLNVVVR